MLFEEVRDRLRSLSPPIEAFGIGGSAGAGQDDPSADLDFFLLVPTQDFLPLIQDFPALIGDQGKSRLVTWRRGFTPQFGYQFVFIYQDLSSVDFFINCPVTWTPTPMARKTRILQDATGRFTSYHRSLPDRAQQAEMLTGNTTAEMLSEAVRIRRYARRGELVSIVHRLERIRLLALAVERYVSLGQDFIPHDADKWVARDLGGATVRQLSKTFPKLDARAVAESYRAVVDQLHTALGNHDRTALTTTAWLSVRPLVDQTCAMLGCP